MALVQWTILFAMMTHFQVAGEIELPQIELPPVHETGLASWYGNGAWHGTMTANGEVFDPTRFTCAHRTLPFDTLVLIENRANRRRVWCRINDRGPFGIVTPEGDWDYIVSSSPKENWRGIIDMSHATASALGTIERGLQTVHLRYWTRSSTPSFNLAVLNP
jgi:rare lipoprotein A